MNAQVIVDVQYDFLPGGALAVANGDEVIPPIAAVAAFFDLIVCTQDWHPANHSSFRERGGPWPPHCVQESKGARIHEAILALKPVVVRKGADPAVDSYSGFWDNQRRHETELDKILRDAGVDTVYVCGLATDYCVKATALDAIDAGYRTVLIEDACRGVNLHPGDAAEALRTMRDRGVVIVEHDAIGEGG